MKMKKFISICLIVIMAILPISCGEKELSLREVFENTAKMTSFESANDITLDINFEGVDIPKEDMAVFSAFKNIKVATTTKAVVSSDQKESQIFMNVKPEIMGMSYSIDMWSDVRMDANDPILKAIIAPPAILTMAMEGKQYITMDFTSFLSLQDNNIYPSDEQMRKINEILSKMEDKYDPDFDIYTKEGNKQVDDETFSMYRMKFDNQKLDEIIRYTLTNYAANDEVLTDLKELLTIIGEIIKDPFPEDEFNKLFEEYKKQATDNSSELSKMLDRIRDLNLLGEKGIDIEYLVNKDGIIAGTNTILDLAFNMKSLHEFISTFDDSIPLEKEMENAVIKATVTVASKTTNINGNVEIDIPEVTEENSYDLTEELVPMFEGFSRMDDDFSIDSTSSDGPTGIFV